MLILVTTLTASLPVHATSVLPMSIQQLSQRAVLIFYGTVISSQTQQENDKRIVTLTTFRVDRLIKGQSGATHTIKQIGGTLPNGRAMRIHGVPQYRAGEQYVLFLPQPSSLGFSSPLGLYQGNFSVTDQADVKKVPGARRTLGTDPQARTRTSRTDPHDEVSLDDFIRTIEVYSGQ
jgi:hypothetical protein